MAKSQCSDFLDEVFQFLDEMDNQQSPQQKKIFEQFIAIEKKQQEQLKKQEQWNQDDENQEGYLVYQGNNQEEMFNTKTAYDSKMSFSFKKQAQVHSQTLPFSATNSLNRVHPQHNSICSVTVPISSGSKLGKQATTKSGRIGKAKSSKSEKDARSKKEPTIIRFYHPYQPTQLKIKQEQKNSVQDLYDRGQFANLCKQLGLKNVKNLGIAKVKKQVQCILKYMEGVVQLNPDYMREFQEMIR